MCSSEIRTLLFLGMPYYIMGLSRAFLGSILLVVHMQVRRVESYMLGAPTLCMAGEVPRWVLPDTAWRAEQRHPFSHSVAPQSHRHSTLPDSHSTRDYGGPVWGIG